MAAVGSLLIWVGLGLTLTPALLSAQVGTDAARSSQSAYHQRDHELKQLRPLAERVASVRQLVIKRDVAEFALNEGKLYFLSSVAGREVGVVFVGSGTFHSHRRHPPSSSAWHSLKRARRWRRLLPEWFFCSPTAPQMSCNAG